MPGTITGPLIGSPVSAVSPSTPGVIGEPLRAWKMKPTCQSFVIRLDEAEPIPGLTMHRRQVEVVPPIVGARALVRLRDRDAGW